MPEQVVMYTPEHISKLAKCTVQTIYRHIDRGKFPNARRIGLRKWLVPRHDVIAYLEYDPDELEIVLAQ